MCSGTLAMSWLTHQNLCCELVHACSTLYTLGNLVGQSQEHLKGIAGPLWRDERT